MAASKIEAIRQRIQIPERVKQIPEQLKPKSPTSLDHGADSIPASFAPAVVTPLLATPTLGDVGAVFTMAYATPIAAPPLAVLAALVNPATYPSWNPMFPRATVTKPPELPLPPLLAGSSVAGLAPTDLLLEGAHVTFEVHMSLDPARVTSNSACVITKLEDFTKATATSGGDGHRGRRGYRFCWKTTGWQPPSFVLKAERVHELLESEDGSGTEYRCYETFGGPLAQIIRFTMIGQLEHAFSGFMDGLKTFVEGGSVGGEGNTAATTTSNNDAANTNNTAATTNGGNAANTTAAAPAAVPATAAAAS